MTAVPKSAFDETSGVAYFARMLSKIRLFAAGELPADYHANLGNGADGRMCDFLRVDYATLREQVLSSSASTDQEILEWCYSAGRRFNKGDIIVWNGFILKLGWSDFASGRLQRVKEQAGLSHREDIQTMPQFFDVDEGRKP